MIQEQIKNALIKLKFGGGWSKRALGKEVGLSAATIDSAMDGTMSRVTQTRLSIALKAIAPSPPPKVIKHKPGHMKRYLIRYYNLSKWLTILEYENGIARKYRRTRRRNMSKERAAHVCVQLDFIGKRYLLDLFGEELRKKRVSLGDCYPFEKWVMLIREKFPERRELLKRLSERKEKQNVR